jgi:hypothetical protein
MSVANSCVLSPAIVAVSSAPPYFCIGFDRNMFGFGSSVGLFLFLLGMATTVLRTR